MDYDARICTNDNRNIKMMRNSPDSAYISFNDSEFKYLLELMRTCSVDVRPLMTLDDAEIIICGMQVRIRKRLLKRHLPLLLLAYYDHKHKRPVWMRKLRLLLK